jgi:hypothetical protein
MIAEKDSHPLYIGNMARRHMRTSEHCRQLTRAGLKKRLKRASISLALLASEPTAEAQLSGTEPCWGESLIALTPSPHCLTM